MRKLLLLATVLAAALVAVPALAQDAPIDPDASGGPPVEGPGADAPTEVPPVEGPEAGTPPDEPPVEGPEAGTPPDEPPAEGPEADTPPGGPPVEGPGAGTPPDEPPAEGPEGPPVSVEEDTPVGGPSGEDPEAPLYTPQALQEEEFRESDAGRGILEEIRDRRGGIFQRLLGDDDDEDVEQEVDQEAESGDVELEVDISLSGDNSNQCVAILQSANSGNNQNAQGVAQDNADAEDAELEGGGITVTPELIQDCRQTIEQAAAAGGQPERQPRVKPGVVGAAPRGAEAPAIVVPTIGRPLTGQPLAGLPAARPGALPRTGGILGSDGALLGLGVGALLIGGGLLARRIFQ